MLKVCESVFLSAFSVGSGGRMAGLARFFYAGAALYACRFLPACPAGRSVVGVPWPRYGQMCWFLGRETGRASVPEDATSPLLRHSGHRRGRGIRHFQEKVWQNHFIPPRKNEIPRAIAWVLRHFPARPAEGSRVRSANLGVSCAGGAAGIPCQSSCQRCSQLPRWGTCRNCWIGRHWACARSDRRKRPCETTRTHCPA